MLPCGDHVNWFLMQFNRLSYFAAIWKDFLDRPSLHKHNILMKPFETETN